jgi:ankyrin repeat protein
MQKGLIMSIHSRIGPEGPGQGFGLQNIGTSSQISRILKEGLEPEAMAQEPLLTLLDAKADPLATVPDAYAQKEAATTILEKAVEISLGQKLPSAKELLNAVKEGKTPGLEKMTHVRDAEGKSLIHLALKEAPERQVDLIKQLCMLGCDINAQDRAGKTPLHRAIEADSFDVTKCLLDQGGNIHIRDNNGYTAAETGAASTEITIMIDERVANDNSQSWILTPMHNLGYKIDQNGMCYGIGHMAMHAILANDVATFNERVVKIRTIDPEALQSDIASKSAAEKQDRADILAFCDGICLYHHPKEYSQFIEHKVTKQDARIIAKEIAPVDLVKNEGEIVQVGSSTTAFGSYELKAYFEKMGEAFQNAPAPVAISLIANNHDICLGYIPDKKEWCLFDINMPPARMINNVEQLTEAVRESLSASNDHHICLTSQVYTTELHQPSVEQCMAQIQKETASITEVTETKACVVTESGKTWIEEAACQGDLKTVKALLQHNINVNSADERGVTALIIAAQNGHTDVVQLLLDNGADVQKAAVDGKTALHQASFNGNTGIIKILIENGADANSLTDNGISALTFAAEKGMLQSVQELLESHADVNRTGSTNVTAILVAAQAGHIGIVELLLEKGADVNKAASDTITPLYCAVANGNYGVAGLLLEQGADVNKPDGELVTPLMKAVINENFEMVKLLLSKNPDLTMEASNGYTAEHFAYEQTFQSNRNAASDIFDQLNQARNS